jgi:hypothetical protein
MDMVLRLLRLWLPNFISCHFECRLKHATAKQKQRFGGLEEFDDALRKDAEDRDAKDPATRNQLGMLRRSACLTPLEMKVEIMLKFHR